MNHAKHIAGSLMAALILTGCASSGGSSDATFSTYSAALADAKISIQQAAKSHNEWRDTGKILLKADKAAKSGDFKTATKLAQIAKKQGELAVIQSELEVNAGPR